MGGTSITDERPTVAAVALDLSESLGTVTGQDIVEAAKRRGVTISDGRIQRLDLADIYFELREMKGAK